MIQIIINCEDLFVVNIFFIYKNVFNYILKDAKKGVIFQSFPPVLQLHLKRFEYDFIHDAMIKVILNI